MDLFLLETSIVPDRSLTFTFTVVIAGIGIVLATLAVLILIFAAFGKAVSSAEKKAKEKEMKSSERVAVIPAPPEIETEAEGTLNEQDGIPGEVIAAISAAVYMVEGEGARIKSITKNKAPEFKRNAWAQAAIIDNTRPF